MKVVILAGGFGTRISEDTQFKPKPMIEIGEKPILWHIMKYYAHFGYDDFIICLGYKAEVVKSYFATYYLNDSDIEFNLADNSFKLHRKYQENWHVTLADTGLNTFTGGRIKRIQKYIGKEPFLLTYGDAVSNVDLNKLVEFHNKMGKMLTITAVKPEGRFGVLNIDNENVIRNFTEKNKNDSSWINGGFMVVNPQVFAYISGDETIFEREPLETLAAEGELAAYKHNGFWQCMDTQRDRKMLEDCWLSNPLWKVW